MCLKVEVANNSGSGDMSHGRNRRKVDLGWLVAGPTLNVPPK